MIEGVRQGTEYLLRRVCSAIGKALFPYVLQRPQTGDRLVLQALVHASFRLLQPLFMNVQHYPSLPECVSGIESLPSCQ